MPYVVDIVQGDLSNNGVSRNLTREKLISLGYNVPTGFIELRVLENSNVFPKVRIKKHSPFDYDGPVEIVEGVSIFACVGNRGSVTFSNVEPALVISCRHDG